MSESVVSLPDWAESQLNDHRSAAAAMVDVLPLVLEVAEVAIDRFSKGGTVYTFGNGGSAADAQHLTGELIGRYRRERRPLPAVTLTADATVATCIGNDYSFDESFSRQIEALADAQDLVMAFSTSGKSPNVVNGLKAARDKGATTVLFAGSKNGPAAKYADYVLAAPASFTARIQEMHTFMLHVISEKVDAWVAGEEPTA